MNKLSYKYLGLLLCLLSFTLLVGVNGQIRYNKSGYVDFIQNGNTLESPFVGGMNSPQLQMMDLNLDGKTDIIAFDRSDFRIMTFLRVSGDNFKYAPEFEHLLPVGKYIYKLADLNSDGKLDVFTIADAGELMISLNITPVSGPLKFKDLGAQYYRNQFDSGSFIYYNSLSISTAKTDLPEIKDLDNDGDLDIITYDATYLTYTMFKDVRSEFKWAKDTFEFQNMDYCFGYFWEGFDNNIKLNNCYLQNGNPNFNPKLKPRPAPRHNGGASCWFFDDDNDGDYEMYISNVGFKKITKLKNGKSENKKYYDTMVAWDTMFPVKGKSFQAFTFPAGYMLDVNADSLTDLVLAPNGVADVKETNQVFYYKNTGTKKGANFELHKENFLVDKSLDFGARSAPAFIDYDADGDLDLIVGNNGDFEISGGLKDEISCYENTGTKTKPVYTLKNKKFLLGDSAFQHIIPVCGDIDNDGDIDILLGTAAGKIVWYENTAGKNKPCLFKVKTNSLLNFENYSGEQTFAPEIYDYNKDNINDLIVGMYNGRVAVFKGLGGAFPEFELVSKNAWGMRANLWREDISPAGFDSYGYAVPKIADLDNDGVDELVLGTYFGTPRLYHFNNHDITDSLIADETFLYQVAGKDTVSPYIGRQIVPAIADINGDSIPEMFFGLLRGGLEFAVNEKDGKFGTINKITKDLKVVIYPNPSNNQFVIQLPINNFNWKITCFNIDGQLIQESFMNRNEKQVQIQQQWPNGIYLIKMTNELGEVLVSKLLVNRN